MYNIRKVCDIVNDIIKEIDKYLKSFYPSYTLVSYIELEDSYLFNYMVEIDDPSEYINAIKYNNRYFVPIVDSSCILYNKDSKDIRFINVIENNLLEKINTTKETFII